MTFVSSRCSSPENNSLRTQRGCRSISHMNERAKAHTIQPTIYNNNDTNNKIVYQKYRERRKKAEQAHTFELEIMKEMLKCHVIMANKHFGMLAFRLDLDLIHSISVLYACNDHTSLSFCLFMRRFFSVRLGDVMRGIICVYVAEQSKDQVEKWREIKPNSITNPIHLNLLIFFVL